MPVSRAFSMIDTRRRRYGLLAAAFGLLIFCLFPAQVVGGLAVASGGAALTCQIAALSLAATAALLPQMARAPGMRRRRPGVEAKPLCMSVHVPAHDEPPEVLIGTLRALAAQTGAPAFEVIVIDNNTADRALWRPVARWCAMRRLRSASTPRIRFIHRRGVTGAKAGALNIALAASDPRATHIVVVDADYRVDPDFLRTAARAILDSGADFVQFPQAYHLPGDRGEGVAFELGDYFSRHARAANQAAAMLLTGTLSVIRRDALEAVGGWSDRTVTEDAELGLRLNRAGYRGFYDDRVIGSGMLPLDFSSLQSQRYRWTSGNMRTLVCGFAGRSETADLSAACGGFSRALLATVQLTAWTNFTLPAVTGLGLAALALAVLPETGGLAQVAERLAMLVLILAVCGATLPLAFEAMRRKERMGTALVAIATRVALLPTAALATIAGLLPGRQKFRATGKHLRTKISRASPVAPTLVATGAIGLGLILAGQGLAEWPLTVSGLLMLLPACAAPVCAGELGRYGAALRAEPVAGSPAAYQGT